jgi:hypothetical protein
MYDPDQHPLNGYPESPGNVATYPAPVLVDIASNRCPECARASDEEMIHKRVQVWNMLWQPQTYSLLKPQGGKVVDVVV